MSGDEVARRQAVAVDEDEIVALSFCDGAVPDFRGAKPVVWLPHMAKAPAEIALKPCDHTRCVWARPIIRDHDLETLVRLTR